MTVLLREGVPEGEPERVLVGVPDAVPDRVRVGETVPVPERVRVGEMVPLGVVVAAALGFVLVGEGERV